MLESIILHEEEILIHSHSAVYNGYNMLTIELLVNFASVFLSENTRFLRFSEKTSLKHLITFFRKARYNACEIILFVRSSSDVNLAMTIIVNLYFVTL